MYVKLYLVLDTLAVFVNIRRRYCRIGWTKNEAPNFRSHLHQILIDFRDFIFHTLV